MITTIYHRNLKAIKKFLTPSEQFGKSTKEKFLEGFDAVHKKKGQLSPNQGGVLNPKPEMRGNPSPFFSGGFMSGLRLQFRII